MTQLARRHTLYIGKGPVHGGQGTVSHRFGNALNGIVGGQDQLLGLLDPRLMDHVVDADSVILPEGFRGFPGSDVEIPGNGGQTDVHVGGVPLHIVPDLMHHAVVLGLPAGSGTGLQLRRNGLRQAEAGRQIPAGDQIPAEVIAKEREIQLAAMANDPKNAGKPESILNKIIDGKINAFFKANCLVDQEFVKDSSLSVGAYAKNNGIAVTQYVNWTLGAK